jgi:predicted RNase H-like nuclease (RuvC/YqgF family)
MPKEKNLHYLLSQKITMNLARNHDRGAQCEMLKNHNKLLEAKIDKLTLEIKALADENADLKEIIYTLNQENEGH